MKVPVAVPVVVGLSFRRGSGFRRLHWQPRRNERRYAASPRDGLTHLEKNRKFRWKLAVKEDCAEENAVKAPLSGPLPLILTGPLQPQTAPG